MPMSMVSYVEAALVMLRRKQDAGLSALQLFLQRMVTRDDPQAELPIGGGQHRESFYLAV